MTVPVPIERGARSALAARICSRVSRAAYAAIEARGRFVMCIAGGSVAESCLPRIARAVLPWPQVHILWADERDVPLDSADSNAGAAMRIWAGTPLALGASIHPMPAAAGDLDIAAAGYERELVGLLGDSPMIDLALLGTGEDGHIASLFPGHPSLAVRDQCVIAETDSPKPPARRLTLSMPLLAGSREVIIGAFGAGKEAATVTAATDATASTPLARLIQTATHVTVMRDE